MQYRQQQDTNKQKKIIIILLIINYFLSMMKYNLKWLWNCQSDNHQNSILNKPIPDEMSRLFKNPSILYTLMDNEKLAWNL